MDKFQPGEQVFLRLVFQNAVPLKNAFLVFVHEEDENEHLVFGFKSRDEDKPIGPSMKMLLDFAATITRETKPGVYALDKVNFETYGGNTLDHRGEVGTPRFEVIPEREWAPIVEDISIFRKEHWEAIKRHERES